MDVDDRALVTLISDGDRDAFAVLYDRYANPLFRYLMMHAGLVPQDVEEVISDTFLYIWHAADRYASHTGSVSALLYKIARRKGIKV
jgi:RNA polymerase sigma-70 factor (ECF subfamily)